jgi:hypothetical protein
MKGVGSGDLESLAEELYQSRRDEDELTIHGSRLGLPTPSTARKHAEDPAFSQRRRGHRHQN